MRLVPPPYVVTIWNPRGIQAALEIARPVLARIKPPAVMLHGDLQELQNDGIALTGMAKAMLPAGAAVWWELAGDDGPPDEGAALANRVHLAQAAHKIALPFLSLNCEARWKFNQQGFLESSARKAIVEMRKAAPNLTLSLTSFGQPGEHGTFPWRGFSGVDVYQPEIYGQGDAASVYDWCQKSLAQTSSLRAKGWLTAHPTWPDILAGNVPLAASSWLVDAFETVTMWVVGCSKEADANVMDDQGELLCLCLNALAQERDAAGNPYVGVGRVSRFQYDRGASLVDGKIGRETRALLKL